MPDDRLIVGLDLPDTDAARGEAGPKDILCARGST
jgi:hypothetical protein